MAHPSAGIYASAAAARVPGISAFGVPGGSPYTAVPMGGLVAAAHMPPPIDDKTLLSPWYIGQNTPQSQSKVMLNDLKGSGAIGEFLVVRASATDHILLVKTAKGKATPFSIDAKMVGTLQGYTVRGSTRAFVTIHDLVRYYVNHKNTELPVQLLLPAAHALPQQQMKDEYAGEKGRRSTEDKLRAWAGMPRPELPQGREPTEAQQAQLDRLRAHFQEAGAVDGPDGKLEVEEGDPRIPVHESILRRLLDEKEGLQAKVDELTAQNEKSARHISEQDDALTEAAVKLEEQVLRNKILAGEHSTQLIDKEESKAGLMAQHAAQLAAKETEAEARQRELKEEALAKQVELEAAMAKLRGEMNGRVEALEGQLGQYDELLRNEKESSTLLIKELYDDKKRLHEQIEVLQRVAQDTAHSHGQEVQTLKASIKRVRSEFTLELTRAKHDASVQSQRAKLLSDERRQLLQRLSKHVSGGIGMSKGQFAALVQAGSAATVNPLSGGDGDETYGFGDDVGAGPADEVNSFFADGGDVLAEPHRVWDKVVGSEAHPTSKLAAMQDHLDLLKRRESELAEELQREEAGLAARSSALI